MDPRTAAPRVPEPEAVEFIRFCYRRRRVGWPELYDEMWAVAGRGLYHGYGTEDLAALGIGFSLFDMPALAVLSRQIIDQELAMRRPVTVTIAALPAEGPEPAEAVEVPEPSSAPAAPAVRFGAVPAVA